jgi:hypothetical protein
MRTRIAAPILLLFVFGLSFGVFLSADQASAIIPCNFCICEWHCSSDTGDDCPNPEYPYYAYRINCEPAPPPWNPKPCTCSGQEGTFAGCCAFGF